MEKQGHDNIYFQLLFYYIPWIAVLFIIITLSSQTAGNLPEIQNKWLDKIAHVIEYCILGICTIRVFTLWGEERPQQRNSTIRSEYLLPFLFVVLFGLFDEIHQIYVEGRQFDLIDLAMDVAGMVLAIALVRFNTRVKKYIPVSLKHS